MSVHFLLWVTILRLVGEHHPSMVTFTLLSAAPNQWVGPKTVAPKGCIWYVNFWGEGGPKILNQDGPDPFPQTPLAIFEPLGGKFVFCSLLGIAGCKRVALAPLGLYSDQNQIKWWMGLAKIQAWQNLYSNIDRLSLNNLQTKNVEKFAMEIHHDSKIVFKLHIK